MTKAKRKPARKPARKMTRKPAPVERTREEEAAAWAKKMRDEQAAAYRANRRAWLFPQYPRPMPVPAMPATSALPICQANVRTEPATPQTDRALEGMCALFPDGGGVPPTHLRKTHIWRMVKDWHLADPRARNKPAPSWRVIARIVDALRESDA
jgi:hypothetical protein